MKAETKAKYLGRIDTCRKLLVEALQADYTKEMEESPESADTVRKRLEKMNDAFKETIAAQNALMDGKFLNSTDASNTIYQLEIKIKRLGLGTGTAETPDEEVTDVPNWNSPDMAAALPDRASAMMQKMTQAQQLLNDVYAEFIKEHPVMAMVPAVDDLKQYTKNLNGIMQGLAKVGALL